MVVGALGSCFGSVIVEYGSVSGVRVAPKCVRLLRNGVLADMGWVRDNRELTPEWAEWAGGQKMANMSTVVGVVSYHLE